MFVPHELRARRRGKWKLFSGLGQTFQGDPEWASLPHPPRMWVFDVDSDVFFFGFLQFN